MNRRQLIRALGGGFAASLLPTAVLAAAREVPPAIREIQARWRRFLPAGAAVAEAEPRLSRPPEQWRRELEPPVYRILFEEDTERPFSSPLNDEKRAGLFLCRACKLPLFTSEMKYDSGTGWPSFFTAIPGHLETKVDYKLIWPRTEYHCVKCGGHQGHVFDDGPAPTRERWCNNGLALSFLPHDTA